MTAVEIAVQKVRTLSPAQAEELLEWLASREFVQADESRLDAEIELGFQQLRRGEKIAGSRVHGEIRALSAARRAQNA